MVECRLWYELGGQRYNEQFFTIPRGEIASLRHAVAAIRRRNPAFHLSVSRQVSALRYQRTEDECAA